MFNLGDRINKKIKLIDEFKENQLIKIISKHYNEIHTYKVIKVDKNKVEIQMADHCKSLPYYFIIKETELGDIILERKNGNLIGVIHNVSGLDLEEYLIYAAECL